MTTEKMSSAKMNTEKMTVELNLRRLQEQIEDAEKRAKHLTRRAARTYLGLLGMAYDAGKSLLDESARKLAKAEERGEKIEQTLNRRLSSMESRLTGQVKSWREQVQTRTEELSHDLMERGEEIEDNVRKFVSRMKPDTARTPEARDVQIEVPEQPPFEGYDEMTVQDVLGRLPGFTAETLAAVRAYEAAHKNRVTILREIDARLEASEPAGPAESED